MKQLDVISKEAEAIGAINTIFLRMRSYMDTILIILDLQ